MWMIHTFISKVLSIFFPLHCYECRKEGEAICLQCLHSCKTPLETPKIYITSAFCFKDPLIRKAIHAIKYFHRQDLIHPLANSLAKKIKSEIADTAEAHDWMIVPIPMPHLRKLVRGYNQAELIGRDISKLCNFPISTKILTRSHSPKRQVMVRTRSERLRNQHNSFMVISDVKNMHIILIDDVTTTGATLIEARLELLKSGAHAVKAATLAH